MLAAFFSVKRKHKYFYSRNVLKRLEITSERSLQIQNESQKSGWWSFATVQTSLLIIRVVLRIPSWDPRSPTNHRWSSPLLAHLIVESEVLLKLNQVVLWEFIIGSGRQTTNHDKEDRRLQIIQWMYGKWIIQIKVFWEQEDVLIKIWTSIRRERGLELSCPYESVAKVFPHEESGLSQL